MQLAAFNAFKPSEHVASIREIIPESFSQAGELLFRMNVVERDLNSIQFIIAEAKLENTDDLDISEVQVYKYNYALKSLNLNDGPLTEQWQELFTPEFLLKNEKILFQEILGV